MVGRHPELPIGYVVGDDVVETDVRMAVAATSTACEPSGCPMPCTPGIMFRTQSRSFNTYDAPYSRVEFDAAATTMRAALNGKVSLSVSPNSGSTYVAEVYGTGNDTPWAGSYGAYIYLYQRALNKPSSSWQANYLHEIGHSIGFSAVTSGTCETSTIMYDFWLGDMSKILLSLQPADTCATNIY